MHQSPDWNHDMISGNGQSSSKEETVSHSLCAWVDGKRIDPIPGHVHKIKGDKMQLKKIHGADGIHWRNKAHKKGRNGDDLYYYIAIPDLKKIDPAEKNHLYSHKASIRKINFKEITFRKKITFNEESEVFTIEYSGDNHEYPWLSKPQAPNKVSPEISTPPTDSAKPTPLLKTIKQNKHKRLQNIEQAMPLMVLNNEDECLELSEIEKILLRETDVLKEKINSPLHHQISNPSSGQMFLLNLADLDDWTGTYHCDGFSWKQGHINFWKSFGFTTQKFILRKNSKSFNCFHKMVHFNPSTKMMLIHYFGDNDFVEERPSHGNRKKGKRPFVPTSRIVKVIFNLQRAHFFTFLIPHINCVFF